MKHEASHPRCWVPMLGVLQRLAEGAAGLQGHAGAQQARALSSFTDQAMNQSRLSICYIRCSCSCARAPQKGQLGHGDLLQRNVPKIVEGLAGKKVVGGEG